LADRAGHTGSGALGRGSRSAFTTAQTESGGGVFGQEGKFGGRARGPPGGPDGAGLLEVVVDLGQASAVGVLGLGVEALARVAECRAGQAGRVAAIDLGT